MSMSHVDKGSRPSFKLLCSYIVLSLLISRTTSSETLLREGVALPENWLDILQEPDGTSQLAAAIHEASASTATANQRTSLPQPPPPPSPAPYTVLTATVKAVATTAAPAKRKSPPPPTPPPPPSPYPKAPRSPPSSRPSPPPPTPPPSPPKSVAKRRPPPPKQPLSPPSPPLTPAMPPPKSKTKRPPPPPPSPPPALRPPPLQPPTTPPPPSPSPPPPPPSSPSPPVHTSYPPPPPTSFSPPSQPPSQAPHAPPTPPPKASRSPRFRSPPPGLPLLPPQSPPSSPSPPAQPAAPLEYQLDWASYPSFEAISLFLAKTAEFSRGRCSLSSLGKSVEGRELWLVAVGNASAPAYPDPLRPSLPFAKPKVAYIGNMHGDEKVNLLLLLQLVGELCGDTAADSRLQALVESTMIYIVPSMNPDGYTNSYRWNARGIDLNRNALTQDFPFARPTLKDVAGGSSYSEAAYFLSVGGTSMEPETEAVTSWLAALRPTVSANLHGGALVAGYTLDACDTMGLNMDCDSPESPLPGFLANAYAMNHPRMPAVRRDSNGLGDFVNGTTQGASWYTALGTLADWVHHALRLHMLTLELHANKMPSPASTNFPTLYANNRASFLRLAEMAHSGLRARLLDAVSGQPLLANATLQSPPGMWAPQVEPDGLIWKLGTPNLQYNGTLLPYNPANTSIRYAPVPFSFRVAVGWDDAVNGEGLSGLSVVQTFLAQRLG
ncbi:hypothetical protein Agub_g11041 [Astrephomene gubernaculifera]|uniref:Peptidase M14 domain-containing protein n=1 Tax=Astrephomene gubernaculifera TaxID=47775 RepID=A0AAD3DVT3_9CHLO|nr:hypothetical protein Agub_g11041 [Astrephomene gubernaculifera]